MFEALGQGKASLDSFQGAIGEAEEPEAPPRKQPAHGAGALRVEEEVGTMLLPAPDPVVDRDALAQVGERIREPPEQK